MAKESKPGSGDEGTPATGGPAEDSVTAQGNTLQRAVTVLKRLKVPAPVAAGVLAQHGLTPLSMVDPVVFEKQVSDWLASPAQK